MQKIRFPVFGTDSYESLSLSLSLSHAFFLSYPCIMVVYVSVCVCGGGGGGGGGGREGGRKAWNTSLIIQFSAGSLSLSRGIDAKRHTCSIAEWH